MHVGTDTEGLHGKGLELLVRKANGSRLAMCSPTPT